MALTVRNQENIVAKMKQVFPRASVRMDPGSIRAHVREINTSQIMILNEICADEKSDVSLRRSGTGLSIQFC